MKTPLIPSIVVASFLVSIAQAENAKAIFDSFEMQKAEALSTYLESNPSAEDAMMAESMLIGSYMQLNQADKAAPLLRKRYDSLSKGSDANLQELIPGVIEPLFRVYLESGDKELAQEFIELARRDLMSHPQAMQIMQFFDQMVGQLAMPGIGDTMDIQFTSTEGENVDLAEMQDNPVLVVFWATWCGPCIAEVPNIISTYEKYKDAGFEVVGISLDSDKSALDAFTSEYGMTWPQHFDSDGRGNKFAMEYGISGIPANFLIGTDGKIVASHLRGGALEEEVAKLFE